MILIKIKNIWIKNVHFHLVNCICIMHFPHQLISKRVYISVRVRWYTTKFIMTKTRHNLLNGAFHNNNAPTAIGYINVRLDKQKCSCANIYKNIYPLVYILYSEQTINFPIALQFGCSFSNSNRKYFLMHGVWWCHICVIS